MSLLRSALWQAESLARARWTRRAPAAPGERWLILGYFAIGDLIFFLPVIEALRRARPQARITFLAGRSVLTDEFIPGTGLVDEVIALEHRWENESRLRALGALAGREFDAAILTLSSPAHYFAPLLARIPVRAGHCTRLSAPPHLGRAAAWAWRLKRALVTGELSRRVLLTHPVWNSERAEHAAQRNWRLAQALGLAGQDKLPPRPRLPIGDSARRFARERLGGGKWVGVHLGFEGNAYHKIWQAERFGRVLSRLDRGAAGAVLVGGSEEEAGVSRAARAAGFEPLSLVGKCSLAETFAVIERCELFLTNDTGLAKAAMVLGVPTATLWGPTDPEELGAFWDAERHLDLRTAIVCSPCVRFGMAQARRGIDYADCGHHACLRDFDEAAVIAALSARFPKLFSAAR